MDFKMFCTGEYMRKIKDAYTDDIIYATSQFVVVDRLYDSGNLSVIVKRKNSVKVICLATIDSVYNAWYDDKINYSDVKEILTAFKTHNELCYSY